MKLRVIEINGIQIAVSSKRTTDGFIAIDQYGMVSRVHDDIMRDMLGKEYKETIGYNPFEDDPGHSVEAVWQILDEHEEIANG